MAQVFTAAVRQARRCATRRALCATIAVAPWCSARPGPAASRDEPSGVVFRLDLQRFTEPSAIALTLRHDGRLSEVRYIPSRLLVTAQRTRTLPAAELQRLQARAADASVLEAMWTGRAAGQGLSQGDQFKLWVGARGQTMRTAHGFVDDAPPVIRTLIGDLLSTAERPAPITPPAAAYVRAEPVAPDREASLRSGGRIRFVAMSELAAGARARVAAAVGEPFEFHALTRDQYERLLAHRAHGAELFVAHEGRGPSAPPGRPKAPTAPSGGSERGGTASQLVLFSTQ